MAQLNKFSRGFALAVSASALVGALSMSFVAVAMETSTQPKPPETVSPCRSECYAAFGDCNKLAGEDQEKRLQCKATGNTCLSKCQESDASNKPKPSEPKKEVPACQRDCYYAFGQCNKAAADDQEKHAQCKTDGNTCLSKCPVVSEKPGNDKPSTDKEAAYQEAVKAAHQRFLDGQKKLLEEYRAALEKAWAMKMK